MLNEIDRNAVKRRTPASWRATLSASAQPQLADDPTESAEPGRWREHGLELAPLETFLADKGAPAASERLFSRGELRIAAIACGGYVLVMAALGLFSAVGHRPAITPSLRPPVSAETAGVVEARAISALPASGDPAR
jgi:hypothetical protein